jgi:hypothetical protein
MKKFIALVPLVLAFCSTVAFCSPTAVLTVEGKISVTNVSGKDQYRFEPQDLLALEQATIQTSTNWTPKETFRGPLLSAVLAQVGAKGSTLTICAIDDYCYDVPVSDARKYGVILALTEDGRDLPRDRFGPIWVIYPRDRYPEELNRATYDARFVWQVVRITVK